MRLRGLSVLVFLCACRTREHLPVQAKILALGSHAVLGKRLVLEGTVSQVGPAGGYFVLEDATGKVMVTTERIAVPWRCPEGATIRVSGEMRPLAEARVLALSLEAVERCSVL